MDIDFIFKIAGIGIIIAILNQVLLKMDKGEYTMLITVSGIIIVLIMLIPMIEELLDSIKRIAEF